MDEQEPGQAGQPAQHLGVEQPGKQQQPQQQQQQQTGFDMEADLDFDMLQRPQGLGSTVIQESADYVLQLLHAYAAAFGL
ncbi:GL13569 [Drosophila persimilis]|uniref:GL13569 n=1 Tax=Drosophila persimilis TaxID=7234 RepID=B4GN10_DROPE|nr:GL13569 [Drosophila persimilis]